MIKTSLPFLPDGDFPEWVVLDTSTVRNYAQEPDSQGLIRETLESAKSLGYRICMEQGVLAELTMRFLREAFNYKEWSQLRTFLRKNLDKDYPIFWSGSEYAHQIGVDVSDEIKLEDSAIYYKKCFQHLVGSDIQEDFMKSFEYRNKEGHTYKVKAKSVDEMEELLKSDRGSWIKTFHDIDVER